MTTPQTPLPASASTSPAMACRRADLPFLASSLVSSPRLPPSPLLRHRRVHPPRHVLPVANAITYA
ncbi:hypothetical protein ID866_5746 [Astraeus odoratus]|nr:hypothetical protein ID866_5746 [Astraeus odoratus]